jgi:hypothetical protein
MEPTSFTVKEESQFKGGETEFVKTKLMTRLTYTLDQVRASAWGSLVVLAVDQLLWLFVYATEQEQLTMQCPGLVGSCYVSYSWAGTPRSHHLLVPAFAWYAHVVTKRAQLHQQWHLSLQSGVQV